MLAFWTDNKAMKAIQTAAIVEISNLVMAIVFPILSLRMEGRGDGITFTSAPKAYPLPSTLYPLFQSIDRGFHCRGDFLQLFGGVSLQIDPNQRFGTGGS